MFRLLEILSIKLKEVNGNRGQSRHVEARREHWYVHLHVLTCCFLLCKTWKITFLYFFYFPFIVAIKFVVCIIQGQNPPKYSAAYLSRTLGTKWGTGHIGTADSHFCWFYRRLSWILGWGGGFFSYAKRSNLGIKDFFFICFMFGTKLASWF